MHQRSPEWFEARLGKATSSRFADVLATLRNGGEAAGRRNYRAQLVVERLTGIPVEMYQNGAMKWGEDTEPLARLAYTLETGNEVEEVGFIDHKGVPNCGASPDGFVNQDGLLEIKCPDSATHIAYLRAKTLPPQYKAQVQGQLWVTGRDWCDFVSYDPRMPENAQMLIVRVERDDEYITELSAGVKKFLSEVDQEELFVRDYQ